MNLGLSAVAVLVRDKLAYRADDPSRRGGGQCGNVPLVDCILGVALELALLLPGALPLPLVLLVQALLVR